MIFPWGNSTLLWFSDLLLSTYLNKMIFVLLLLCIGSQMTPTIFFPRRYEIILCVQEHPCWTTWIFWLHWPRHQEVILWYHCKNNLYYLKPNLIITAKIVRSKSKIENWCTYAPIISVLSQPGKYVRKIITTMYIHHKMIHPSHKKIQ